MYLKKYIENNIIYVNSWVLSLHYWMKIDKKDYISTHILFYSIFSKNWLCEHVITKETKRLL